MGLLHMGWMYRKLDCCALEGCTEDGTFVHLVGVWQEGLKCMK